MRAFLLLLSSCGVYSSGIPQPLPLFPWGRKPTNLRGSLLKLVEEVVTCFGRCRHVGTTASNPSRNVTDQGDYGTFLSSLDVIFNSHEFLPVRLTSGRHRRCLYHLLNSTLSVLAQQLIKQIKLMRRVCSFRRITQQIFDPTFTRLQGRMERKIRERICNLEGNNVLSSS